MSNDGQDTDAPEGNTGGASRSAFEKLAREIALRDAKEDFEYLPHGSKLYFVEKGWKSFMIKDDPRVVEVLSLLELGEALEEKRTSIIFVPISAVISIEGIRKVCQRYGADIAVFKEVEGND